MSQNSLATEIGELFKVVQRRETFLNVSENENFALFHGILILKCLTAGYGAKKIVPRNLTFTILWFNFLNSMLIDKGWNSLLHNFSFCVAAFLCQAYLLFKKLTFLLNAMWWYIACLDGHFHFCLDVYVVVALLIYIYRVYKNHPIDTMLMTTSLFMTEWISNQLIEPMDLCNSLITLFFPVMLTTSFIRSDDRSFRVVWVLTADVTWFFYKLIRVGFIEPMPIFWRLLEINYTEMGKVPPMFWDFYSE